MEWDVHLTTTRLSVLGLASVSTASVKLGWCSSSFLRPPPGRRIRPPWSVLPHGIRNEILEEFAKKKEMCHLKGKKTRTFPVIRRHYESYDVFSRRDPNLAAIGSIN